MLRPFKVGDRVLGQYHLGDDETGWFEGDIQKLNSDGTYTIKYVDDGKLQKLPTSRIIAVPSAGATEQTHEH